jgi:hypothetical protein
MISCAQVVTHTFNLLSVFQWYQAYYSEKQAIQYFLTYLHLSEAFHALPTLVEMKTLLSLYCDTPHRDVQAYDSEDSQLTFIDRSSASLQDKLKDMTLEGLLSMISAYYQQDPVYFNAVFISAG